MFLAGGVGGGEEALRYGSEVKLDLDFCTQNATASLRTARRTVPREDFVALIVNFLPTGSFFGCENRGGKCVATKVRLSRLYVTCLLLRCATSAF